MLLKRQLVEVVLAYRSRGYGATDIARALHLSRARIRQLLDDQRNARPRIRSDADIPAELLQITLSIRQCRNGSAETAPEVQQ
jgi:DNA-binding transcriptional regulator LsrR (DeoR family)